MKLFLIIGKSYCGKNYFLDYILEDKEFCEKYNIERLIEGTTRKPREGEVDGKDYYFVSYEEFRNNYLNRSNIVYSRYDTEYGSLYYFIDKSKLDPNKNYIGITNVEILETMKLNKEFLHCIEIIYLIPPNYELFSRFSMRKENSDYDDKKYKEICRRFMDDLKKFGVKSNKYLSGVRSIINIGKDVPIKSIERMMRIGIENDNADSVIIDPDKAWTFDYNYDPSLNIINLEPIIDGKIPIANGKIIIDTEQESFDFY